MKVYVEDLLVKNCSCCDFCYINSQGCVCKLTGHITRYDEPLEKMRSKCPLKSLADYTKQVRKEVCEEIRDMAGNYFELPICYNCGEASNDDVVLTGNDLTEILDQI